MLIQDKISVFIYALSHPVSGEVAYVGKTICPAARKATHLADTQSNPDKLRWIASLRADGLIPELEIIEELLASDADGIWQESERFWIVYFRFLGFKLTNKSSGGLHGWLASAEARKNMSEAQRGRTVSKQHRAKISRTLTGRKNGPCSEETKLKISRANAGRKPAAKTIVALKLKLTGKPLLPETRRKMSAAREGRTLPESHRENISKGKRLAWAKIKATKHNEDYVN